MPTNINFGTKLGISAGASITLPTSSGFADTQSFLYDGVDDFQEGTSWSTLDASPEFTISMWVKVNSLSATQNIISGYETGTAVNLYMYIYTNGQIEVWSGGSGSNWTRSVVGAIVVGQWYHIVMRLSDVSVNRYSRQRIFIDGVVSLGTSNYYTGPIPNGTSWGVGANWNYSHPAYLYPTNGNINEVAIWGSNALTDAQILEVYNSGSANDLKTLPTAPSPTNWYRSENASWLGGAYYETSDEMGNGSKLNSRNMVEASRVNDVPPNPFDLFSTTFDGVDDYVDCGDNINLAITNISISAWIKTTADGSIMVADDSNGARRRWIFNTQASGTLLFLFWNTSSTIKSIAGTTAVNDGIWHHVMAINNGTDLKLYIDGVLDNSSLDGDTMNVNAYTYIHIGNSNYGGGANYFDGSIDEVAIWSNDQSSNVTTIYNSGVPNDVSTLSPLGYWRMGDGSTYPTINDLGSGSNDGTMNNMTSANFVADVPPTFNVYSTTFDGVDDYVDTAQSFLNSASVFSFSFWAKKVVASDVVLIGHRISTYQGAWVSWYTDGNVYFTVRSGTNITLSTPIPFDTNWHHFLCTKNGTDGKIFVDGVLAASTPTNGAVANITPATFGNDFRIGSIDASTFGKSIIDEVSLFSTSLSQTNVTDIYNLGTPTDISAMSGLVSYYRMGDGSTYPTINDEIGSNDGTMNNMSSANFVTDVPT